MNVPKFLFAPALAVACELARVAARSWRATSQAAWRFCQPKIGIGQLGLLVACGACVLSAFAPRVVAAEAQDEDARLRQALRAVTLQLRASENDKAALQSGQAALADEKKALIGKLEALKKDVVAERATTDKAIADLKAKMATQAAEIERLRASEQKWQTSSTQVTAQAASTEAARAKLADQVVWLERRVETLQRQNLELFRTGNEILTRYEKFGLGDALAAREPFVGWTRTKLENLVQGYEDSLAANRAK